MITQLHWNGETIADRMHQSHCGLKFEKKSWLFRKFASGRRHSEYGKRIKSSKKGSNRFNLPVIKERKIRTFACDKNAKKVFSVMIVKRWNRGWWKQHQMEMKKQNELLSRIEIHFISWTKSSFHCSSLEHRILNSTNKWMLTDKLTAASLNVVGREWDMYSPEDHSSNALRQLRPRAYSE